MSWQILLRYAYVSVINNNFACHLYRYMDFLHVDGRYSIMAFSRAHVCVHLHEHVGVNVLFVHASAFDIS